MNSLIKRVLEAEGVKDFPKKITDEIIRVSEGCPRQALVTLDAVIDIEDDDKALEAVSVVTIGEAEVIEICRGIMNNESWSTMRIKVKNVLQDNEPEKVRYACLGYFSAILLNANAGDNRVSSLIDLFSENTYASGKAGLINAIYLSRK